MKRQLLFTLLLGLALSLGLRAQTFDDSEMVFPGVYWGSNAWGDYDINGRIDFIIYGDNASTQISNLYCNLPDHSFDLRTTGLPGSRYGRLVWGDYDNDGYLDVLLTGEQINTSIYRNNGDETFALQTEVVLPKLRNSSADWGDFNNDGLLDFIICGDEFQGSGNFTQVYKNIGNNTFEAQKQIILPQITSGDVKWGDYNHDGFLDILISGSTSGGGVTRIYTNNGNGNFDSYIALDGPNNYCFVSWLDYNNDSFLDVFVMGQLGSGIVKLYGNNDNGTFTEISTSITGEYNGSAVCADLNNDGYTDIAITGPYGGYSKVYFGNGSGGFVFEENLLPGVGAGFISAADYDSDGDLDLLLQGQSNTGLITKLYNNLTSTPNTAPTAPDNLNEGISENVVTFSWDAPSDNETPSAGLTYNLRVGTTTGGNNIVASNTTGTGVRTLVNFGNVQTKTTYSLSLFEQGTYYWSVQAIDNGFASSPFSVEGSFSYTGDVQAKYLTASKGTNSVDLEWVRGSGNACVVFVKEGEFQPLQPTDNLTYSADANFGDGDQHESSGWFCVYNGLNDLLTVTGLEAGKEYAVVVLEYEGASGSERYYTVEGINNFTSLITNLFTEETNFISTQLCYGSSAWGDFNNDGYLDIIITGSNNSSQPITEVYLNDGDETFTKVTSHGVENLRLSSVSLYDFDNDNLVDVLATGINSAGTSKSLVYKSNGDGTFTLQSEIILQGVYYSSTDWGDYNNDGFVDILLAGQTGNGYFTMLYKNDGDGTFSAQTSISLEQVQVGAVKWVDFNNDGLLDIFLTGQSTTSSVVTKLYKNNGDNSFTVQTGLPFANLNNSSADWADYNNDGYPDVIMSGWNGSTRSCKVYTNNSGTSFTALADIQLAGTSNGRVIWADYNNDGFADIAQVGTTTGSNDGVLLRFYENGSDGTFSEFVQDYMPGLYNAWIEMGDYNNDSKLDLLLMGQNADGLFTKLYKNYVSDPNTAPSAATIISNTLNENVVTLAWNPASDTETPSSGLSYNIKVGTVSGGNELVASNSAADGTRRINKRGNVQQNTSYSLNLYERGTYYWSVQAVDHNFVGSEFYIEGSFDYTGDVQAKYLTPDRSINTANLDWTRGSGDVCVVFMKEGDYENIQLTDNATYSANTVFGLGSEFESSGWFCVYNDVGTTVSVSGLLAGTKYSAVVLEYEGTSGSERYYTVDGVENITSFSTILFTEETPADISNLREGSSAWGDFNNDGFLDFIVTGYNISSQPTTEVFFNDGDNTFTKQASHGIVNLRNSSVTLGDYDNDGFIDAFVTGYSTAVVSKVFHNNSGDGSFTEVAEAVIEGIQEGSSACGDYNNDGFLDILISGRNAASQYITKLYTNNGDGTFTENTQTAFQGVYVSSIAWADYDNDGLLDFIIIGYTGSSPKTNLYKNNGDGSFALQTGLPFSNVSSGSVAWGDYDNDGYLDLLLMGWTGSVRISKIYRNNGSGSFSEELGANLTGLTGGQSVWVDYNNDGYLDVLICGTTNGSNSGAFSKIYKNKGNLTFSLVEVNDLIPLNKSSVSVADFNNDSKSDVLLLGLSSTNQNTTKLYLNETDNDNTRPTTPTNLATSVNGNQITFTWDKSTDNETPQNGLSYNLYVYEVISGDYATYTEAFPQTDAKNGQRLVARMGNIRWRAEGYTLTLPLKNYFWSVQAIDAGYMGSEFAVEQKLELVMQLEYDTNLGDGTSVTLPLYGSVNVTVDWGDGSTPDLFNTPNQYSHTYDTEGVYIVSISGSLAYFGLPGTSLVNIEKLVKVHSFGSLGITNLSGAFRGATNLTEVPATLPSTVTNLSMAFMEASNFNHDISTWDVSNVTDMTNMFYGAVTFNQNIDGWNVGNVTNMSQMFGNCVEFNQDLNSWDVSKVINMSRMFNSASKFNGNISSWNVGNVTNMSFMFELSSVFNHNISTWNVGKVTNMMGIFHYASKFNQPLNTWNVSSVINMMSMFQNAAEFNQDISNWNVGNVTNMTSMFASVPLFNQDIGSWNVGNVEYMNSMFHSASAFNGNISGWNTSKVTTMASMFYGCTAFNQDISGWDVSLVENMQSLFQGATSFNQDLENWNTQRVTNMYQMFSGATSFNGRIESWDVSNVESMISMFNGASNFNGDISNWDVGSVMYIQAMFYNATAFNQNISSWNVSNVINMATMFQGATSFNQDISNWNISSVTNMSSMFTGATLSTYNYNNLLIGWAGQTAQNGVIFSGGNSKYSPGDAADARAALIGTYGWTITDGGESNLPAISTLASFEITSSTAISGGNISSDGGSAVTVRGVVWNTSIDPTIGSNLGITTDGTGTGAFTSSLTGLSENTTYYVRAYATNGNGTEYGQNMEFTTLNELTITGTFTANNKIYDGTSTATFNLNNLALNGIVPEISDVSISSVTLAFSDENVANDKDVTIVSVELTGNDAHQYFLNLTGAPTALANITKKELTVTAENKTVTYGDVVPALSYTISGFVAGEDETDISGEPLISTTYTSATPVASSPVTITAAINTLAAANYSFAFVNGNITINTKELTVGGAFTVADRTYDGTINAVSATNTLSLTGVVNSDAVTLSPVLAFDDKNIGTAKVVSLIESSALAGDDSGNYTLSLTGAPTATAAITAKALTVGGTFTVADRIYDGTTVASTATNSLSLTGVVTSETVTLTPALSFADKNVGTAKVVSLTDASTLGGADMANYTLSLNGAPTATAAITAKTLTVISTVVANKVYDGTTAATISGAALNGVISPDVVTLTNHTTGTFASENVGIDVAVTTAMTIGGSDAGNYSVTQPAGLTADITALELTIGGTFTAEDKEYDGTTTATIAENNLTLLTPITGDEVELINVAADFEDAEIGVDKIVTISAAELDGADKSNYTISIVGAPTTTATISELTFTLTLEVNPEGYGVVTGEGSYAEGAEVALTATANENYQFVNWKKGETVVSTEPNFNYSMPSENVTLTAYFEEIPAETYTVTFTVLDQAGSAPIEGASITINEQILTTNADGVATIDLENGEYPYSVSAEGYAPLEGSVTVNGEDVNEGVSLTHVDVEVSALSSIGVYPNPFRNEIRISNASEVRRVLITNIIGKVVMNVELNPSSNQAIENNLPTGIYLVTIVASDGLKVVRKMVRE